LYKLDYNHAPDFYQTEKNFNLRLRSGDEQSIEKLNTLNNFFEKEFNFKYASYSDFSPYSIAEFLHKILPQNAKLAYSSKLGFFCANAIDILRLFGIECIEILATKDGTYCKESISNAKHLGAQYFFGALVDEDIFYKNSLEHFDTDKTILDISNAIKKCEIPKTLAQIFWGYKLGALKASGVFLSDALADFNLQNIDLFGYAHLKEAYKAYSIDKNCADLKTIFIKSLQNILKESIYFYTQSSIDNAVCIGFKGIMARDFIRSLALDGILVTNGELCSLGLSKPSNILQKLGISENEARNAISFSFNNLTIEDINFLASKISFKYMQLKAILG
jgi:hypothetical protein